MIQQRTPDSVCENTGNLQNPGGRISFIAGRVEQVAGTTSFPFCAAQFRSMKSRAGSVFGWIRDAGAPGDGRPGQGGV